MYITVRFMWDAKKSTVDISSTTQLQKSTQSRKVSRNASDISLLIFCSSSFPSGLGT
jgi:hypothetical protein